MFALVVVAVVALGRRPSTRKLYRALGAVDRRAAGRCSSRLGIANVAFGVPLALAAAHNAGAAALLAALVVLNFFAFRGLRPAR